MTTTIARQRQDAESNRYLQAFDWLKAEREGLHGSIRTWRGEVRQKFDNDLALLIDFLRHIEKPDQTRTT